FDAERRGDPLADEAADGPAERAAEKRPEGREPDLGELPSERGPVHDQASFLAKRDFRAAQKPPVCTTGPRGAGVGAEESPPEGAGWDGAGVGLATGASAGVTGGGSGGLVIATTVPGGALIGAWSPRRA